MAENLVNSWGSFFALLSNLLRRWERESVYDRTWDHLYNQLGNCAVKSGDKLLLSNDPQAFHSS